MCQSTLNRPGHDPDHPGQNHHHPNSLGHIGWGVTGGILLQHSKNCLAF